MTDQLNIKLHAPSPKTAQGYASCFVLSKDKKWLGYVVKNIVVIRSMENLLEAKSYTKHICEVTALAFHPEGKLAASADVKGNISFWYIDKLIEDKKIENAFSGKINGLEPEDETDFLSMIDPKSEGRVTKKNFLEGVEAMYTIPDNYMPEIIEAFKTFDKNGDGKILVKDFKNLLLNLTGEYQMKDVENLFEI